MEGPSHRLHSIPPVPCSIPSRTCSISPLCLQPTCAIWQAGFAVVDSVAPLKFQEYGVPKEYMTYLASVLMPLEILLPIFAIRWTSGAMPFSLALWMYPFKVAIVPVTALLAYSTPSMEPFPWAYWVAMMAVALVGSVTTEWMFVSQIALFAKVIFAKG